MKKAKTMTWSNSCKRVKVIADQEVVELREDRGLFARIMIAARSRPDIDIRNIIATHKLSVVPRAMFSSSGALLHCTGKSQLMSILENRVNYEILNKSEDSVGKVAAIVDGMVEVQALGKPHWVKDCSNLAEHFIQVISRKYFLNHDEVHLVFDRYDLPKTLKACTRRKRLGKAESVAYHITDSTNLTNVSLSKLLSHSLTKDELSTYFSIKTLEYASQNNLRLVCAWKDQARSTFHDTKHLQSSQEEADTKLVLHALDATKRGISMLPVYSLDTDVLILLLRRYPQLSKSPKFCTGTGTRYREIDLRHIYCSLTPLQAEALPGFHAFSGADVTGTFCGKGKLSFWKAFESSEESVFQALPNLGKNSLNDEIESELERFTCTVYCPKTSISDIGELRWWMFKQKQAEAEKLPPTRAALKQRILRCEYQAMIWNNDIVAKPQLPSPTMFGWTKESKEYIPVMTDLPPAPAAMIELILCKCKKNQCASSRCKCKAKNLLCTELCACESDEVKCRNTALTQIDLELQEEIEI